MDNAVTTDDDRQTSSNGKSSSDDISSESTQTLSPVHENRRRPISSMSGIHVRPVKVITRNSLPNMKIKHPYRQDDTECDQYDDEKIIITDEHVKVFHMKRSSLRSLNTEISLSRLNASSRRRSIGTVSVLRSNTNVSKNVIGNITNRESTQMASRLSTLRAIGTTTAASITQGSDTKLITCKPVVTRISFSNELPFKMIQKESKVTVKHISVNQKKTS
jgi:hypothetical protein